MMAPFDTALLKYPSNTHRLPTEAERTAARMKPSPRTPVLVILVRALAGRREGRRWATSETLADS